MSAPVIVLKLGGSVLSCDEALPQAVAEVARFVRGGHRVVAVVSAIGGTTDALLAKARRWGGAADGEAQAVLVATGETQSAALLALALSKARVPAQVLDVDRAGLRALGEVHDARPVAVDVDAIERGLAAVPVVVIPGFTARDAQGRVVLLGRGGSDLTAVFVAAELGARLRLVKDVPGLYERDPALPGPAPRRLRTVHWDEALCLDERIVQHAAVRLARSRRIEIEIAAVDRDDATRIGDVRGAFFDEDAVAIVAPPLATGIATRLVRFDATPGDVHRPTSPPLHQTATFVQESPLRPSGHDYTRSGNPTRDALERQLAQLEDARHALAYGSGMAAIAAVVGLVPTGAEILAGDDLYGGTSRLLGQILPRRGVVARHADPRDIDAFVACVSKRTRLVHVESPSNPRLAIVDVPRLAAALRERAEALGVVCPILCVDGTLMTPYLQRPLELGADVVVHSATKALCGHGDVTAGVVATDLENLARELAFSRNAEGTALAPFESWLLLRGLKTLALRLDRQQASAQVVAGFLAGRSEVSSLAYPGLADHPGALVHARQSRGPGFVLSFELEDEHAVERFARELRLLPVTVSFGAVGSSLCCPATMSHASIPPARREDAPPPGLVRLSIGLEDPEDLVADLSRALDIVGRTCVRQAVAAGGA